MEVASALRRAYSGEEDDGMWGWLGVGRVVAGYYIHVETPGVWGVVVVWLPRGVFL